MRPFANWHFDPVALVQTPRGAGQALKCGKTSVYALVMAGKLELIDGKITTESIRNLVEEKRQQAKARQQKTPTRAQEIGQ